jgi:hypothetical protein
MAVRVLRVYADTSVFGGCLDDEYAEASRQFFEQVRHGAFRLVVSDTTLLELTQAPEEVRRILPTLPVENVEHVGLSLAIEELRDAYIAQGVVGPASARDAEHIAAATVADVDLVVSWNFRHIVHYEKISGYQGVNLLKGYRAVRIHSPSEVI